LFGVSSEPSPVIVTPLDLGLDGKVAVVTGASRGIGRATAVALADAGADLVLCARNADALEPVADTIRSRGRRAVPVSANVGVEADRVRLVETAAAELGRIDCLVSNASHQDSYLDEPDEDVLWDAHYKVDLRGAAHLTDLVVPHMKAAGAGSIVFISSISGKVARGRNHGYTAAKAALIAAGKSLGLGLAPEGIRVNTVAPGSIHEQGNAWDRMKEVDPERYRQTLASMPMGRFGRPDEVADCVVFLLSERARWIVGHCLVVDGGQYRGIH
jgi:3-oxoacyl-[acyl-carrier protein] reductase